MTDRPGRAVAPAARPSAGGHLPVATSSLRVRNRRPSEGNAMPSEGDARPVPDDATPEDASVTDARHEASGTPVVVIGGRGFLGRAIVSAFHRAGAPVVARGSADPAVRSGRLDPVVAAAPTVVVASGRSNPALADRQPDTAALELEESRTLFALLSEVPHRQRVVLASSGGTVYDTRVAPPYREDARTARSSAYAGLKLDLEESFLAGSSNASRRTVFRVSNVYGPGQRLGTGQGVVGHWFAALAAGETVRLFGDPATIRDYVYVDDVAAAFVAGHRTDGTLPPVLNVGSGEPTTLRELLDRILIAAGRPGHPVELVADRPFDRRHTWLDVRAAREALGWTAVTPMAEGLERTWRAFTRTAVP